MSNLSQLSFEEYRVLLRNDLMSFIERSFHELNPQANFHGWPLHRAGGLNLREMPDGKTKRLIINLPPRTLKSHAASVAFPAWLLGHDPSTQIICASYGQDLSRQARQGLPNADEQFVLSRPVPANLAFARKALCE